MGGPRAPSADGSGRNAMTRTTSHANWIRRAPRRWEWALAITGLAVAAVLAWRLAFVIRVDP
jgi:hypothetical protein